MNKKIATIILVMLFIMFSLAIYGFIAQPQEYVNVTTTAIGYIPSSSDLYVRRGENISFSILVSGSSDEYVYVAVLPENVPESIYVIALYNMSIKFPKGLRVIVYGEPIRIKLSEQLERIVDVDYMKVVRGRSRVKVVVGGEARLGTYQMRISTLYSKSSAGADTYIRVHVVE